MYNYKQCKPVTVKYADSHAHFVMPLAKYDTWYNVQDIVFGKRHNEVGDIIIDTGHFHKDASVKVYRTVCCSPQ